MIKIKEIEEIIAKEIKDAIEKGKEKRQKLLEELLEKYQNYPPIINKKMEEIKEIDKKINELEKELEKIQCHHNWIENPNFTPRKFLGFGNISEKSQWICDICNSQKTLYHKKWKEKEFGSVNVQDGWDDEPIYYDYEEVIYKERDFVLYEGKAKEEEEKRKEIEEFKKVKTKKENELDTIYQNYQYLQDKINELENYEEKNKDNYNLSETYHKIIEIIEKIEKEIKNFIYEEAKIKFEIEKEKIEKLSTSTNPKRAYFKKIIEEKDKYIMEMQIITYRYDIYGEIDPINEEITSFNVIDKNKVKEKFKELLKKEGFIIEDEDDWKVLKKILKKEVM